MWRGVLRLRGLSAKHFLAAVPKTAKRIAVLDRTKEPGAQGEPLYRLLGVVSEVSLTILVGVVSDDFYGVLVGSYRTVGSETEELGFVSALSYRLPR